MGLNCQVITLPYGSNSVTDGTVVSVSVSVANVLPSSAPVGTLNTKPVRDVTILSQFSSYYTALLGPTVQSVTHVTATHTHIHSRNQTDAYKVVELSNQAAVLSTC